MTEKEANLPEFTDIPMNGMDGAIRVISAQPVDSLIRPLIELMRTGRMFQAGEYTFTKGFVDGTIEFYNGDCTEIPQEKLDRVAATLIRCYGGARVIYGPETCAPLRDGGAKKNCVRRGEATYTPGRKPCRRSKMRFLRRR